MQELFDTEGLAEFLHTPIHTLHYWRARGDGKGPRGIKVGKRILYRREDVEKWLDEKASEDPMASRPTK